MFDNDCYCKKYNNKCCSKIIIGILVALITFVAGVLIGALTGLFAALGLGAFIAILAILVILLIIQIILAICCKNDKKYDDCC